MRKNGKPEKALREKRKATMFEAVLSIVLLLICFGFGAFSGINYVPIMALVAGFAIFLGWRCGFTWKEMEYASSGRIRKSVPVLMIFIAIGALVGGFMFCGTLPMLIYYGIRVISPQWLALSSFILCVIFSTTTGTSNGSVSTAGLAMMGLATSMGGSVNIGLVAGAIYAGSMFGDKMSPLSDTTIMASMITDNDIFDHIRHMSKTVGPAAIISIIIYIITGVSHPGASNIMGESTIELLNTLDRMYHWNIVLLIPVAFVLWGAITKKPSGLILFSAAFIAVLIGVFYQDFSIVDGLNGLYNGFTAKMVTVARPDFDVDFMSSAAATLLNRGGINSMLRPVCNVLICMYFTGIMELIGALDVILNKLLAFVKSPGSLVLVSGLSVAFLSAVGGSTAVGILIGGEIYKSKYTDMGLHTLNLSRTLEDFGTGCTGFFPWTSSGILYASVLGVSNLTFLQYSFFSWITWILAIFYGFSGICLKKLPLVKEALTAEQALLLERYS